MKIKKIFTNARVIIVIIAIILTFVAISPNPWHKGVAIRNVMHNSSASLAGIQSPKPNIAPMRREVILAIDQKEINSLEDYYNFKLEVNRTYQIKTNRNFYKLTTREKVEVIELNETEEKEISEVVKINKTIDGKVIEVNETVTKTILVPKTIAVSKGLEDIGLRVFEAPKTNIRKGLDLQGGTRVLLAPEKKQTKIDINTLIDNMKERLNVYGLSDIIIREVNDLSANQYVLVEIAGANEEEVKELLAKQGKFEARIGNETVFIGGKDITYVCRSADCAGIDPSGGCWQISEGFACRFRFSITLSGEAAQKQADLTKDLDIVVQDDRQYLSQKLILFLDDQQVDELLIGADLKGKAATDIEISGSGVGATQQEATFNSLKEMKRLQTILITGSLPVKMEIIKTDAISPVLGEEFTRNALITGLLAIVVVSIILLIRYRTLKVSIPMLLISLAEIFILMGFAALIGWNIDVAAIAGIIVAIGTGVNDQIVIIDETLKGEVRMIFDWKERIKRAFSIIFAAYFTVFVAMIPLIFAGAGLLKGFAITSIIGITVGVLITRPAYAAIVEILMKE